MIQEVVKNIFSQIKEFCLDLFFPRFCLGCNREGNWLCDDCLATLEIQGQVFCPICLKRVIDFKTCRSCQSKTHLSGLLWALPYQNPLVKKLIQQFKYQPFIKELSQPLAYLIISHLFLTDYSQATTLTPPPTELKAKEKWLQEFVLIPIPLHKRRRRWRGFDQAEEISKEISNYFGLPTLNNILIRKKETLPQVDLEGKEREENIKGAFICLNQGVVQGRKIFLVDDIYTTGATMEEAARVLKEAGAKQIWGMVVARG
ncbi:MAG: hypothetical protein COX34_02210 [Candidatus Nealsonbacteria bacterium CG23_combo_of_CG06-09_8_20_14_all_36_12]|uniref:Phosphoribosyltransferase domain-containing protein n=2 Tax=Candidatus Nealsoniibacteriota TaxID=1817911 RepID=A0A2H0TN68_9BACT|nr:MAG: hypothetical protein COX34_02210 [Candidatus Nealsonbacteria bacterium CG23_combo_of_CG06-09_8_20_14_all_36_12]PIR72996.1 MAG: hypothetical protein COV26_00865 [Candidatus Nealsonbacteria bacterium CG10_big_fil_rev_8_21_14_0_10_36_23]